MLIRNCQDGRLVFCGEFLVGETMEELNFEVIVPTVERDLILSVCDFILNDDSESEFFHELVAGVKCVFEPCGTSSCDRFLTRDDLHTLLRMLISAFFAKEFDDYSFILFEMKETLSQFLDDCVVAPWAWVGSLLVVEPADLVSVLHNEDVHVDRHDNVRCSRDSGALFGTLFGTPSVCPYCGSPLDWSEFLDRETSEVQKNELSV